MAALALLGPPEARAQSAAYRIETTAGSDRAGDGGPAAAAQLSAVQGIAADRTGNLYAADTDHHRLRRISPTGVITTIGGNGQAGFAGDGRAGAESQLHLPYGVAADAAGNVFVADFGNHRVRRISTNGVITTAAGNGRQGSGGDGGPATAAPLMGPRNVAVDASGNLYIAEFEGHRVRRVSPGGVITTVAGIGVAGFRGDNGPAAQAQLAFPAGLALDPAGALYIADSGNARVRKVSPEGVISTVVGGPGSLQAAPVGLAVDAAGALYLAERGAVVRRIGPGGVVPVAGGATAGFGGDGGPATAAFLYSAADVAFGPGGELYIADGVRIRRVSAAGIITTVAGDGYLRSVGDGGPAREAQLHRPAAVSLDAAGNLYIADAGTHRIRKVDARGFISTAAGSGAAGLAAEFTPPPQAPLNRPGGIALDPAGRLFLSDTLNHRVRMAAGVLATVAGGGAGDLGAEGGPGLLWSLGAPSGLAADRAGNLYIADTANHRVLLRKPQGTLSTVAGNGSAGAAGDGARASLAQLREPAAVAVDGDGNVYVADTLNHRVRRIAAATGVISTVAGTGDPGFSGDGGPAAAARLRLPRGVAVDGDGNLYIADTGNHRIRRAAPGGVIVTIAGFDAAGFDGDGGPATAAKLNGPSGLAVDGSGRIYFCDTLNDRVRRLTPEAAAAPVESAPAAAVVNAASLRGGAVAPGEIVTIFTSAPGPDRGVTAALGAGGQIETSVAGVRALFDGEPAPLFYAGPGQINAQAPYSLAARGSATVEVEYQGTVRARTTVAVAASAPGLFTTAGGAGAAVAVHPDGTLNGPGNAASRGSVITLFATGEGQTDPPGSSGRPAQATLARPELPVLLTIGNTPAEILYAGAAPGFAGLLQINARVPALLGAGQLEVVLTVGSNASQPGVTLSVR